MKRTKEVIFRYWASFLDSFIETHEIDFETLVFLLEMTKLNLLKADIDPYNKIELYDLLFKKK